jgi:hypothetical protein
MSGLEVGLVWEMPLESGLEAGYVWLTQEKACPVRFSGIRLGGRICLT